MTSPRRGIMAYQQPELFERLIALLIDATVIYLSAQIEAGAEAVMLFDSWAGLLPPAEFRRHVIRPTQAIVAALQGTLSERADHRLSSAGGHADR